MAHQQQQAGFFEAAHALLFFLTFTAPVWMIGIFMMELHYQPDHGAVPNPGYHPWTWGRFFEYWGLNTPDQAAGALLWCVGITATWVFHSWVRGKVAARQTEG